MPAIERPKVDYLSERGIREEASPTESWAYNDSRTTRIQRVPWHQRFRAVRGLLGFSQLERDGTGAITGLRRLNPLPHPGMNGAEGTEDFPGNYYAVKVLECKPAKPLAGETAVGAEAELVDEEAEDYTPPKTSAYMWADITVQYESVGFSVLEDDDIETWPQGEYERYFKLQEVNTAFEYITLPGGSLKFIKSGGANPPTGLPIGFNTGRVFSRLEYKYIWRRLPGDLFSHVSPTNWQKRIWGDPDDATALPLMGTVNKTAFLGCPAGTLLLTHVCPVPLDALFDGIREWDMECRFSFDPHGWNRKFFCPSGNAADRGFYLVGAGTDYYAPDAIPDNYSIYNVREHRDIFDVRDVLS